MRKTEFTSEDFNTAHDYAAGYFATGILSIHSFLWNIIINDSLNGQMVVFYFQFGEKGIELVIANAEGGYNHTGLYFISEDYDEASEMCMHLTYLVWNVELEEAVEIISDSMEFTEAEIVG